MTAQAILEKLVAFPTVSSGSNLHLIDYVEDYLNSHGVSVTIDLNEDGTKAGIFASIGPDVPGGVILSGHTDVVPVEGQNWSTDPWKADLRDGRIYGRGTCDMKGFAAIILACVPEMIAAGLQRPIQIALTRDEEIGCLGAPPLINKIRQSYAPASSVIVGEPTMMKVVTGHKGSTGVTVHVRGFEVHSSMLHKGVSAIMIASRLVDWANAMNSENSAKPPGDLAAGFDPPWTSLHVGMISGGTAHNITAGDCSFGLEIRCIPGESIESWKQRFLEYVRATERDMHEVNSSTAIHATPWFDVPPLKPENDPVAESLARRLTGDNGNHRVSYATEAGQFQEAGYSVVVCGPGHIDQAHQGDEFISVQQIEAGTEFVRRLINELSN